MGTCFSSQQVPATVPSAKIVSANGDLHEYNLPAFVSQVLEAEATFSSSSSSSSNNNYFLCNSDFLTYDDYIPQLNPNSQLQPNQIYFVLRKSKLQYKLAATDMAALAVKASVALQNDSKKGARRRKKAQISPVLSVNQMPSDPDYNNSTIDTSNYMSKSFDGQKRRKQQSQPSVAFTRSGSVRRLQKYASRRGKLAVRSFRLKLSTIYEGTVV